MTFLQRDHERVIASSAFDRRFRFAALDIGVGNTGLDGERRFLYVHIRMCGACVRSACR
jgi:hypothetical protein